MDEQPSSSGAQAPPTDYEALQIAWMNEQYVPPREAPALHAANAIGRLISTARAARAARALTGGRPLPIRYAPELLPHQEDLIARIKEAIALQATAAHLLHLCHRRRHGAHASRYSCSIAGTGRVVTNQTSPAGLRPAAAIVKAIVAAHRRPAHSSAFRTNRRTPLLRCAGVSDREPGAGGGPGSVAVRDGH